MVDRAYMWRVAVVAVALLCIFGIFTARLTHLHVGANEARQERIRKMRSVDNTILIGRGRILDAKGKLFALDVPVRNVCVDPDTILSNKLAKSVSRHLAAELELPFEQVFNRVNRPGRRYEAIARLVREEKTARIEQMRLPGVFFESLTARHYPHTDMACHVLGFSNLEGIGSAGVEQRWDSLLKGRPGLLQGERDGRRRELYTRRSLEVAPQEGADVYLTLDQTVQHYAEEALDYAMEEFQCEAAWAIVEDVYTGAILAMASRPAYDPNLYNKAAADDRRNRAVAVNFEPGSIFKALVVAAAIDQGVVASNEVFDCENGRWLFAGKVLNDVSRYGELDVTGILRKSSNIGSAKIALVLGEDRLHSYLKAFGLGRPTGIELPGEEGGILNPASRWGKLDLTRIAMGHGVAATALQMLNAFCSIGSDGFLMQPYLVQKIVDKDGVVLHETKPKALSRPITERTARIMREMLHEVTKPEGTGRAAAIKGYTVAGKTGSAEKLAPGGGYLKDQNISSFMGLIPADRPQIGIIVVLDNPQTIRADGRVVRTGGATAAPVFARLAEPLVRYLDIRPLDADDPEYYRPMPEDGV